MSSFTESLIVSPLCDGKRWVIRKEFFYFLKEDEGDKVSVPAGFVTDFASIPRYFWKALPRWGKYGNAAVVHDYLYATGLRKRKECDEIFLEAMSVLDVPLWKRYAMFYAVRWFGWIGYGSGGRFLEVSDEKEDINKIELQVY
jgi:hypothetical protein